MSFFHWECPDCEFDIVLKAGAPRPYCPLCAVDNHHEVAMTGRPATDADQPEGLDERSAPGEANMSEFTDKLKEPWRPRNFRKAMLVYGVIGVVGAVLLTVLKIMAP